MNILKLQELLESLVKLIEHECTGTPTELAQQLGVTDRTVKRCIAQLRDMGADIKYCTHLNSYYFASPITFRFGFEPEIDNEDSPSNGGEEVTYTE
ncbi:MAG: helix-turn-helix domain-containing protein [Tenuifilaceae bacterium]|nr:helix-turn-helix domain-containing protein [Tenuifilaceae bacterium]